MARGEGDNASVLPRAYLHPEEFAQEVEKVEKELIERGEVIRIRHELHDDRSGDPMVLFLVVMPDSSFEQEDLLTPTRSVSNALRQGIHPYEQWGVWPYFRYRSQSEQNAAKEPSWA